MKKRRNLITKGSILTVLILCVLAVGPLSVCASEDEYHAAVTRLDEAGYLYYMDYTKDYYGPEVTNASGVSMTQYSVIYNNERKTVWPFQNYSETFMFDVERNRIPTDR